MTKKNHTLYHFSEKPIVFDSEKEYELLTDFFKPNGLWLSDETNHGWQEWCLIQDFKINALKYIYKVEVEANKKLLHIQNKKELLLFTEKYVSQDSLNIPVGFVFCLNWKKVMLDYSGILITPYINEARLVSRLSWYCLWDCASACIWDLSLIKNFELIKKKGNKK